MRLSITKVFPCLGNDQRLALQQAREEVAKSDTPKHVNINPSVFLQSSQALVSNNVPPVEIKD